MAIKKNITTESGFSCDSYMIVQNLIYIKDEATQGQLLKFKDQASKDAGLQPFSVWNFTFKFDINSSKNIIEQAYDAIKLHPDYSDCVDV